MKRASGKDFPVHMVDRRPGDPAALVAGADRIREVLGWVPQRNNLDTIVEDALSWEKRLQEHHTAS
jgi:UDP-glucose 4-epimerase